jgi:hypothetical protein
MILFYNSNLILNIPKFAVAEMPIEPFFNAEWKH